TFFDTFGASPLMGRVFTAEEDRPGAALVAVLSYDLWQSRFGNDSAILQKDVSLNGRKFKVIGVLPKTFGFGREVNNEYQIFVPLALSPAQLADSNWTNEFIETEARLKPGVTIEQARTDMDRIVAGLKERLRGAGQLYMDEIPFRIKVQLLKEDIVGN